MTHFTLKGVSSDGGGAFDPSGNGRTFATHDEAFEYAKEYARCVAGNGEWWTEIVDDDAIVIARTTTGYEERVRVVGHMTPTYEARDGFVTRTFDTQSGSSVTR